MTGQSRDKLDDHASHAKPLTSERVAGRDPAPPARIAPGAGLGRWDVVVAPEPVRGVVERLFLAQAPPGGRVEERGRVAWLLDEARGSRPPEGRIADCTAPRPARTARADSSSNTRASENRLRVPGSVARTPARTSAPRRPAARRSPRVGRRRAGRGHSGRGSTRPDPPSRAVPGPPAAPWRGCRSPTPACAGARARVARRPRPR